MVWYALVGFSYIKHNKQTRSNENQVSGGNRTGAVKMNNYGWITS